MWKRLNALYSLRVVNVNVNIVAAGILALIPTLVAVHFVELWLARPTKLGMRLGAHHKVTISAVTFGVDVLSDVCFYYALHFVANHWPSRLKYRPQDAEHTQVPFFKDATIVQFQRMVLSPLLYTIWLGTQQVLMQAFDVSSVNATAIGCVTAILTIRTIHTFWMIKAEAKRRLRRGAELLHLAPRTTAAANVQELKRVRTPGGDGPPGAPPASGKGPQPSPDGTHAGRTGPVNP
jgi:hypothetical protein